MHRYDEERELIEDHIEAMARAISKTITSISGSSLTTIAGFLVLCLMQLLLGKDIGIVMAKGVLLGVISTITFLPALILVMDKPIHRFSHKTILPTFEKAAKIVTDKYIVFIIIFVIAFIPAIYGKNHTKVYYNLDESLPDDMESLVATNMLKDEYNMLTTHFILVRDDLEKYKINSIIDEIEEVDGVEKVIALEKYLGPTVPDSFLPEDLLNEFKKGGYELLIVNSKFKAARDDENIQIDEINKIIKKYDKDSLLTGEGVLTKDLIEIADEDFRMVNYASIIAILIIIGILFKSIAIPVILVTSIELAIFINMSIPFYTNTTIPFIASIVIGCIQLGATVDYAILMTTRFREEIRNGLSSHDAIQTSVMGSARSIVTSALTFFAATVGVGIISKISIIKSLCIMIARGAIISMIIIVFVLPSLLLISEKIISKTTYKWKEEKTV